MTGIMTAHQGNSEQYFSFPKLLPIPSNFPYVENVAYEEVLSSLLYASYQNEKSLQIRFLNGSEKDAIINGLLSYVQINGNVEQASRELGKTMPKERRKTKQSVDDFVNGVSFVREGNSILLINQYKSDSFQDYTLDLYALTKHLKRQQKHLNTTQ